MIYLLANWFISALSLMIVAHVISGFTVRSFGSALLASLVIGLVNATVGIILKLITLPLTIVTFGLFLFVVNALMLMLAASVVPGFRVEGFLPAFVGAIILAIVSTLLRHLVFS